MPRFTLLLSAVAASLIALPPVNASAQQDTTPPVLLEFTISPVLFDSGPNQVTINWCATARDDLAGVTSFGLVFGTQGNTSTVSSASLPSPLLEATVCRQFTIQRFSPYGTYRLGVSLGDNIGNTAYYWNPLIQTGPGFVDLCTFSDANACEIVNRLENGLPDADNDGIPDDADNCPTIANPDQADADLDLIGDGCDPFPNDRDNDQAQCEVDLAQCIASQTSCAADLAQAQQDLATCQGTLAATATTLADTQTALTSCTSDLSGVEAQLASERADADGDGVRDLDDDCPGTPPAVDVDRQGCSQAQFCDAISVLDSTGRKLCLRADWKNDEPLMKTRERDCAIDRNLPGPADDRCIAAP